MPLIYIKHFNTFWIHFAEPIVIFLRLWQNTKISTIETKYELQLENKANNNFFLFLIITKKSYEIF